MLLAGDLLFSSSWYAPFYSMFAVQGLLLSSHLSLLDNTKRGASIRVLLSIPTLYFILDLSFNPRYSLGSPMRDLAWGAVGWYLVAKALDVGLVYGLEGLPPPRWCVPDWTKEAKKEDDSQNIGCVEGKSCKPLPFWKRSPLPKRPRWAVDSNYLPCHWRILALPTRSIDQLIWAIDVLLLRRPGTSLLFPSEMRALEWSQKRLETAAECRRDKKRWRKNARLHPCISPFGYSETSYIDAVIQMIAVIFALYYIASLDIPASHPRGFYGLPMYQQLLISTCMGVMLALPADLPELIAFPLLQQWPLHLPCTAITPHFRNVARSKNLTDMWGFQWHGFIKRDVMRLSKLIPFARNNRAMLLLKSFFWSAVFHSFLFVRVRPEIVLSSPLTLLHSFYFPGSYALFMGQGLLVIAENIFKRLTSTTPLYKHIYSDPLLSYLVSYLQTIYVYGSLIWMARWLIAELVPLQLLTYKEIHAMTLSQQWHDYSTYWKERFVEIF